MRNLVLDDQDGLPADALAQHTEHRLNLGFGQTGERLVEQQHLRLGQDRHGDLQPAFLAQAQILHQPVAHALQVEGFQRLDDFRIVALAFAGVEQQRQHRRRAVRAEKGQHQVVDDAEIVERRGELERPHQAARDPLLRRHAGDVFAMVVDRSFVGRKKTGQQIEKRGLAGAVRADDAGDLVFAQQVADVIDRDLLAEPLGDAFGSDDLGARVHVSPCS